MEKRERKFETCVYCGRDGELTRDHVPPENLFSKPRPNDLITVPSCLSCNTLASKDDEYFRLNIISREDTPITPGARKVFRTTMRGLERPHRPGLKNDLLSRTYLDEKYSAGGIYLGPVVKYDIDAQRMDEVAKRIVKGLFYNELGKRLSDEYFVSAFSISGEIGVPRDLHVTASQLKEQPEKLVGNGDVFTYRYRVLSRESNISQWLLAFYGKTEYLGFTVPNKPEFMSFQTPYICF